ncbi:MAG TPA: tyrosine-type recombinase/integrase [Anaerolineae bacterium]|nr:tyrosine-type recombinase/integrase [Anaerolineae bacterium]
MKLSQAIDLFIVAGQAANLAHPTIIQYQQYLGRLLDFLGDNELSNLTSADLQRFMAHLSTRQVKWESHRGGRPAVKGMLSPSTLNGYALNIKRLFNWLEENGYIPPEQNIGSRLKKPKLPRLPPKAITDEDFQKLVNCARREIHRDCLAKRDYLLVLFLGETGCRVGGLVRICLSDIDFGRGRILVTEKGNKSRYLYFTSPTDAAMRDWLNVRPSKTEFLFVGKKGDQWSIFGVSQALRRLGKRAGTKGHINPHSFRHGFAKRYLENGGDLASLSEMMGHTDVSVTKNFYSMFTNEELKRKHERFSPLRGFV